MVIEQKINKQEAVSMSLVIIFSKKYSYTDYYTQYSIILYGDGGQGRGPLLDRNEVEKDLFFSSCDTMSIASLQELENNILCCIIDASAAGISNSATTGSGGGNDELTCAREDRFILYSLL